jgi:signal transduction histidine kinase/CheY-like chemotaxis protein
MNTIYYNYNYILFIASFVGGIVGFLAWKRRTSKGSVPIVILMSAIFVWCFFQALAGLENDFNIKVIFSNIRYFGIEFAPISFYALAYGYKNGIKDLSLKRWLQLLIIPFLNIIGLWTNPLHHKFYTFVTIEKHILTSGNGIIYWFNMIYLYIFMGMGIYIFIKASIRSEAIYRKQAMLMILAALFPLVANIIFNSNLLPQQNIDITPISFFISGILYFWALFKFKLLDIVPIARDRLVENMVDIVIVIDNHNRVLDLNKKAREVILINNNTEYIGKDILAVLETWEELGKLIIDSKDKNSKINFIRKSQVEYYDLNISDIYEEKGKKNGKIIVLRDITKLEEALLQAQNAREQAEYANKAKGYFLANMSHEIRTPMNAVIGIADILDTMAISKVEQKKYIRMIVNSAESLLIIINGILDFSKIEAGKMELESNIFNIKSTINDIVETFSILAQNKHLTLAATIEESLNNRFIGDAVKLKQILINLLGNSIKFTEEGKVEVDVKQTKLENNRTSIIIKVRDTGIGIAKDKIDSVFESFKQVDNSSTRKFGGTGLGLSIVKSLVELMGGNISVESELGIGSTFSINIPFEIEVLNIGNSLESDGNIKRNTNLEGLKILVADDNKINRQIINTYLTKLSCTFDFAENGLQAVEKFSQETFEIIIMDIQMPEMDGLQATKLIREIEREKGGHIYIVALTAGAMKEDVEQCLEAGMDEHLSKPIKMEKLYSTLKAYVDTHDKN